MSNPLNSKNLDGIAAAYFADMPDASSKPSSAEFEQEVTRLVTGVRNVFTRWIDRLPGKVCNAAQLHRATKLDLKLCWKVFRVTKATDALAASAYVPGSANMRDLIAAIRRSGDDALADRASRAADAFDDLVTRHAGDRRTFDTMVSTWADRDCARADARFRRDAFAAASHLWGVQVDTMSNATAIRPSRRADSIDMISIACEVGLKRVRRTSLPLFRRTLRKLNEHDSPRAVVPLGDHGDRRGIGIVSHLCTQPLPELMSSVRSDGTSMISLAHEPLGSAGALNLVAAAKMSRMGSRWRTDHERIGFIGQEVGKPCRLLVVDLLVERGTFPQSLKPRAHMIPQRINLDLRIDDVPAEGQLAPCEIVSHVGRGPQPLDITEAPQHAAAIRYAMDKVGWNPSHFDLYRCHVHFPITLSTVVMVYDLPEKP